MTSEFFTDDDLEIFPEALPSFDVATGFVSRSDYAGQVLNRVSEISIVVDSLQLSRKN